MIDEVVGICGELEPSSFVDGEHLLESDIPVLEARPVDAIADTLLQVEGPCGWLKDRFGLSWQIIPDRLYELLSEPDRARATAATQAMYGMRKIVIADLEEAAESAGQLTR